MVDSTDKETSGAGADSVQDIVVDSTDNETSGAGADSVQDIVVPEHDEISGLPDLADAFTDNEYAYLEAMYRASETTKDIARFDTSKLLCHLLSVEPNELPIDSKGEIVTNRAALRRAASHQLVIAGQLDAKRTALQHARNPDINPVREDGREHAWPLYTKPAWVITVR